MKLLKGTRGGEKMRSVVQKNQSGRDEGAQRINPFQSMAWGATPGKWKERPPHPSCTTHQEGECSKESIMSATEVFAEVLRLAHVGMICAYRADLETPIVEYLSKHCAGHRGGTRLFHLPDERSAIAAFTGAASTGIRAFTLAFNGINHLLDQLSSWEPSIGINIVMAEIRGETGPIPFIRSPWKVPALHKSVKCIKLCCENNQEILDTILQAYRLGSLVNLPVSIVLNDPGHYQDTQSVKIPGQKTVHQFLGPSESPQRVLQPEPASIPRSGPTRFRDGCLAVTETTKTVHAGLQEVEDQYEYIFRRRWGMVEPICCNDAEVIIVTTGTASCAGRKAIHALRMRGEKAGLLKIKLLHPFPADSVRRAVGSAKKIAIVPGGLPPEEQYLLTREVASALEGLPGPPIIFGNSLNSGGHPLTPGMVQEIHLRMKYNVLPYHESMSIDFR